MGHCHWFFANTKQILGVQIYWCMRFGHFKSTSQCQNKIKVKAATHDPWNAVEVDLNSWAKIGGGHDMKIAAKLKSPPTLSFYNFFLSFLFFFSLFLFFWKFLGLFCGWWYNWKSLASEVGYSYSRATQTFLCEAHFLEGSIGMKYIRKVKWALNGHFFSSCTHFYVSSNPKTMPATLILELVWITSSSSKSRFSKLFVIDI